MKVLGYFIPVTIAIVFAVVFLAAFPAINTLLRSVTMPVGLLPIVGGIVTLMPYLICAVAFYVVILIVKGRISG